jgi:hypothetical protein
MTNFLRTYWPRLLAISFAVIAPCFWHPHIEAGDLPSHVYNAWLVHLIKAGQTPGLWLARRWNNVLFDFTLSGLGTIVGWGTAEKIATCGAVLIFFWGAFALICAISRRLPWFLLPCLVIVTYGWTFEMGFMNYYTSIGLAFFGVAILVSVRGWQRGLAALLAPLIWLAHPFGLALFVCVGAYIVLTGYLGPRRHWYLFLMSVLLLLGSHLFIRIHCNPQNVFWSYEPHYVHDGFDQLLLYGPQCLLPARLFRAFLWACLLIDIVRRRATARWWSPYLVASELYVLSVVGILLLPTGIDTHLTRSLGLLSIGFVSERLSTASAVLVCCLLGTLKPHKWHVVGCSVIAAIFLFQLYKDTAAISRMEDQLDRLVRTIPPRQRVIAPIAVFPTMANATTTHVIDRACIEHCFSYANYEASTGQFRVRANFGNPFVMTDWKAEEQVTFGGYVVEAHDLPLHQIYQTDSNLTTLGIRELAVGETTSSAFGKIRTHKYVQHFNGAALLTDLLLGPVILAGAGAGRWLTTRVA